MRHVFAMLTLCAIARSACVPLAAQSDVKTLAFEVASIKENKSADVGGMSSGTEAGHYSASNMPLYFMVLGAYHLLDHQLAGMPDWTRTTRYNIAASYPPGARPNEEQLNEMVRSLLGERFHLVAHHEMRELPVYELTLARKDGQL